MICARFRLAAIALCASGSGILIYLVDRPPTLFTSFLAVSVPIAPSSTQPSFDLPLSGQLPTFLHVFAFMLLALALQPHLSRLLVVVAGLSVGLSLEFAQLAAWPWPLSAGTFDPLDLLGCAAGAAVFLAVARLLLPSHSPGESGRRPLGRGVALLATVAVLTSLATSPPPPPGNLAADLNQVCPGSEVELVWQWDGPEGDDFELFLVASDPNAFSPSFERLAVASYGTKFVTVHDAVEFHLEGGRFDSASPAFIQMIPQEGIVEEARSLSVCSGGQLTWDPVVFSAEAYDANAAVGEVTAIDVDYFDSYEGAITVQKGAVNARLEPEASTLAFQGQVFTGAWQIEAADPLEDHTCPIAPPQTHVSVGVQIRVVCPAVP